MEYAYVAPPLPTLARWRALRRKFPGQSVLRALEYEQLETLDITGHVLDVGGGRHARTNHFLSGAARVDSINIRADMEPTWLVEPDKPFPMESDTYDAAVCLNTLEHIYDADLVIREIHRVLKPSSTVFITVPFIFRIHASPDDYFRGTPSWWKRTLQSVGFSRTELQPLTWGRYTTAGMVCGYRGPLPAGLQRNCAYLKDILYAWLAFRGLDRYGGRRGERVCAVSPGWFVSATK